MKRKIYSLLVFLMGLFSTLDALGGEYYYEKGQLVFEVEETRYEYRVYCSKAGSTLSSRNKNIADRQQRMTAVDLIGSYILYKSSVFSKDLGPEFFSIYVDGIELHYSAYLEGLRQEELIHRGKQVVCYSCPKTAYKISLASFRDKFEFSQSLLQHYRNAKNQSSASLVYKFPEFTSAQYLMLERDFLLGEVLLPEGVRQLQSNQDRFELSIFQNEQDGFFLPDKKDVPDSSPYSSFFYEEMVTASPLKEKESVFKEWGKRLGAGHSTYEDILLFCVDKCSRKLSNFEDVTFSDVIEAFPGAISPFGIRQPIDNQSYSKAATAYAQSDFVLAADILRKSIDQEGVSASSLNLLGASYRFLGMPDKALPYLLLCLKLEPETPYLLGNIYLCLVQMKYQAKEALRTFLATLAKDSWSKNAINK